MHRVKVSPILSLIGTRSPVPLSQGPIVETNRMIRHDGGAHSYKEPFVLHDPDHAIRQSQPFRWVAILVAFAIIGAFAAPLAPAAAQTTGASPDGGIIDLAPDTSLVFAHANLDMTSDQALMATELFTRAGLGNVLEEPGMSGFDQIPANAQAAIVVTSFPEATSIDVADVSVNPMAASDSLDGGFAAIFSADDVEAFYQEAISDLQVDAEHLGGEVVESEYGGVTITSHQPAADDTFTDPTSLAMVGDSLVLAMRAEDIHPIIDTFNGDIPSLTANENYQAVFELLPTDYLGSGFFNGPATLAEIEATAPDTLDGLDDQAIANLDSWTGFTFSAEQQGFRLETRSIQSAAAFAEQVPIDGAFFDTVPSDAVFATNGTNLDSNGIVTMLALVFASGLVGEDLTATPIADVDLEIAQNEVFTQAESLLGFNLKTDLIDNLVGEFGIAVTVGNVFAQVPTIDAIVVSDIENPTVVQDAVSKISFIVGAVLQGESAAVESRDVNGSVVNVIDLTGTELDMKVEFGVVGDEIVVSVGNGLDDYILGPESSLSQAPNFQAVLEVMPAEYGSLTFINMPVVLDIVHELSNELAGGSIEDADPSCGEFATQEEAQAVYDEDPFGNFMLDQNFDGQACEDYFAPASASPEAEAAGNPYSNVLGLAVATTQEDDVKGTTTFLLIGDDQ